MGNQWGTFTFASPQTKCWGDVSSRPPYDRRPWMRAWIAYAMQSFAVLSNAFLYIAVECIDIL